MMNRTEQLEYLKDYVWEFYEYIKTELSRDKFTEMYSNILAEIYDLSSMSNLKIVQNKKGTRLMWDHIALLKSEEKF